MNDKLRIGEISYANCTPIYSTLKEAADCRDYEFVPGDPAALNRLLAAGEIDVSASSSIEYMRHWREYLIIPGISISSVGEVKSILLFSKKPIERLGGERVSVSSASATSAVLLKALLINMYGAACEFAPMSPDLEDMLAGSAAALLIGDEALKERLRIGDGTGLFVYDLGRLWHEFTGLPFVFALWMVREDSALRMPGLVGRFKDDIVAAKESAGRDFRRIAGEAREGAWMGRDGLVDYWNSMSYDLGDEHVRGLEAFFEMAARLGEAPDTPRLRFL